MDATPVEDLRRFNRFYTRRIGLLSKRFLNSDFSLAEVRVLYEIAHRARAAASEIAADLSMDPGYLSRMLLRFEQDGLIARERSDDDGRRSRLSLTAKGKRVFDRLDRAQHDEIAAMLRSLGEEDTQRLTECARTLQQLLGAPAQRANGFILREPRPGDIGWVVQRHGAIYAAEYGWNEQFEALVGEIASAFLKHHDPKRERCWIAEHQGRNAGCIFLVRKSNAVAQLRLLLVEPAARGLGIGRALVRECIEFARAAGYRKIALWTNRGLDAARHLYEEAGFKLAGEERHRTFGKSLTGQNWELHI
ncbi:MAG TPA: bifunctional helix-turn-helix transcriptional regulator/GNAT family N-acetyltransferase [Candidatus Baltobacteraceae bacterium]|jgi:DNA-binding MarR family transcriptional regulator/N-acetylglutamate synthase-like GNAT family acetyltransferase|nr:bifunctional helix-turn-helix transcriptional regulator/GNAT family N-acetyltransferase [Candidatus Baltobacteraceae bacterium]